MNINLFLMLGGGAVVPSLTWLLSGGVWSDTGAWDDAAVWEDS